MIRRPVDIEVIQKILSKYDKKDVKLGEHCYKRVRQEERDISEELVKERLMKKDLYLAEKQIKNNEIRYKIIFKLSSKYDLILIVTEEKPKILKVITAIKSSKKIKKEWQKKSILNMRK